MGVLDITEDNIEVFLKLIDEDMAENIGKKHYRGKALTDKNDEPVGVLIWEYKNLSNDGDTEAELACLTLDKKADSKALFESYKKDTSEEGVLRTYFEFADLPVNVSKAIAEDFDTQKCKGHSYTCTTLCQRP